MSDTQYTVTHACDELGGTYEVSPVDLVTDDLQEACRLAADLNRRCAVPGISRSDGAALLSAPSAVLRDPAAARWVDRYGREV